MGNVQRASLAGSRASLKRSDSRESDVSTTAT